MCRSTRFYRIESFTIYPKDYFPCNPDLRRAWSQRVMPSEMSKEVRLIPSQPTFGKRKRKWCSLWRMGELAIRLVYGWLLGLFTKLKQCDFPENCKVVFLYIGLQLMYFAVFLHWLSDLQENFSTSRTKVEELLRFQLGQAGRRRSNSSRTTGFLSRSGRSADHGWSNPGGDGKLPFDKGSFLRP